MECFIFVMFLTFTGERAHKGALIKYSAWRILKGWPPGQERKAPCDRGQLAREKLSTFGSKTAKMLCMMHGGMMGRIESRVNHGSPGRPTRRAAAIAFPGFGPPQLAVKGSPAAVREGRRSR